MKIQWIAAALLSSALAAGCGDRGNQNAQIPQENSGPTTSDEQVLNEHHPDEEAVSPDADIPAVQPDTRDARSTAVTRAPASPRVAPAPAPERRPAEPRSNNVVTPRQETPRQETRNAPREAAAAPRAPVVREVTVPAGTPLPLELTTALSTETATVEMPVTARLRQAITIDGATALPAGTVLHGEVVDVARAGRVQGRARLAVRFTEATVNGQREALRTNPVTFEGEQTKGEDATKIGAGAGIGAVIGGIVGGGDGAAKGAAIGGAAGTGAVLATRGREVQLAAGTDINVTTASAVDIRVR